MSYSELDLFRLTEAVTAAAAAGEDPDPDPERLLAGLHALLELRQAVDLLEPQLIAAARAAGASWQRLAPALGVASRQAAERRYLRLIPATAEQAGSTREQRVQQVRDERAGNRAVTAWASHNTADLRRLAGQITALTDLDPAAASDVAQLHEALGDSSAAALPRLLQQTRRHLDGHPGLGSQIDAVTAHATRVRHETERQRDKGADARSGHEPA